MNRSQSPSLLLRILLAGTAACSAGTLLAQGPPPQNRDGHYDRDNRRGEQGRPDNRGPQNYGDRGGPGRPGGGSQPGYRFGNDDRNRFAQRYRSDAMRWRNRRDRPRFYAGYAIPRNYALRPVPPSYWAGGPPPPPGYQYGYYDGYVVAYNPATRIIADVLDLVAGGF